MIKKDYDHYEPFDLSTLRIGDEFYGAVANVKSGVFCFTHLWYVKKMRVEDEDENSILVSYDTRTRKHPTKIRKELSMMYGSTKLETWKRILKHYSSMKITDANKRRIAQAKRAIRKEERRIRQDDKKFPNDNSG